MTIERAKKLLPIIQAYAEGKQIEFRTKGNYCWLLAETPTWTDGVEYRIKPEEEAEITSVEELRNAIFIKKGEISSRGEDDSLFIDMTISKKMVKDIEDRYSCLFRTDEGNVKTFYGIPFKVGDKTKVEIKDRLVELSKKECEKPASCRFSKKGIELDKVESLLSELSKRGIFILAEEIDARLFPGTDGKLRMKEMDCTIHFYEAENTKENL